MFGTKVVTTLPWRASRSFKTTIPYGGFPPYGSKADMSANVYAARYSHRVDDVQPDSDRSSTPRASLHSRVQKRNQCCVRFDAADPHALALNENDPRSA